MPTKDSIPNDTEIEFLEAIKLAKKKKEEAKKSKGKKDEKKTILGLGKMMHAKAQERSKARKKKAAEEAKAKEALKQKKSMLAALEKHQQEEREAKIRGRNICVSDNFIIKSVAIHHWSCGTFIVGEYLPFYLEKRHAKIRNIELRDRQDFHRYHWAIQWCVTVYRNQWFHTGMLGLITLNVIILALDQFPSLNRETMEVRAFSCFYI